MCARITRGVLGGMYGGRPVIEKYGRYVLLSRHDLDIADRWFASHGEAIVFVSVYCRPFARLSRFPAGVARMNLKPVYHLYIRGFAAVVPWPGIYRSKLGEQWNKDDTLKTWFTGLILLSASLERWP